MQSAAFSDVLRGRRVPHRLLSANNDAEEADIIAVAGVAGAVTVATQMAGRGVDIVLDDRARVAGGLMIWGFEHHPSRRLDMQLRGRAGRQGDPGETRFASCPADEVVVVGQMVAERLDSELRANIRAFDRVVDELHELLYEWRRRCAHGDVESELEAAVAAVATEISRAAKARRAELAGDIAGLGLDGIRRVRTASRYEDIEARLGDVLHERHEVFGGPIAFSAVARVVLSHLLVAMWADELDLVEAQKLFTRATGPAGDDDRWRITAHQRYGQFTDTVRHEWIAQLAALQLGAVEAPPDDDGPALPVANTASAARIDAPEPPPAWEGFSFNRWVRNHFGVLLNWEPPVVLALDAVGDTTASPAARVRLDLDDPGRSVVELLEFPGAQSHERHR